jgi:hypothetical protein
MKPSDGHGKIYKNPITKLIEFIEYLTPVVDVLD